MPSIRVSTLLGHVGAGICAGNSKVRSTTLLPSRSVRAASGLAAARRASIKLLAPMEGLLVCRCQTPEYERADSWQLTLNAASAVVTSCNYLYGGSIVSSLLLALEGEGAHVPPAEGGCRCACAALEHSLQRLCLHTSGSTPPSRTGLMSGKQKANLLCMFRLYL